ncbi:MAG: ABC transporter ATP-binding protein, partial [Lentisphaeria bacterium]|nr:ABC transporter ATP-binding protein [Lentisphaeria bacterium]
MPLLQVKDLSIGFLTDGKEVPTVSDVNFTLEKGECFAFVGESGCGKSVSCMALAKLLPMPPAVIQSGEVLLEKRSGETVDVLKLSPRELRKIRGGEIAYIFQEPSMSLNPVFRVGDQIAESILLHRPETEEPYKEAEELLRQVGIPDPADRVKRYPHELSGGMQQRVMIAMALASHPSILVADEPTTALDVTIQAQILELLMELKKTLGMAVILVTHNFGLVAEIADHVAVMYAGRIVEKAKVDLLLHDPLHPYTKALLAAVPVLGGSRKRLETIPGTVPLPAEVPPGCRFCGRCGLVPEKEEEKCRENAPPLREILPGHSCACFFA